MHLALRGARPDSAPGDQIRDELRRDGVEELAAGGQPELHHFEQEAASLAQACPLDLQAEACAPGHCALTQFNQFSVLIHINEPSSYDLYVERSYGEELFSVLACQ